MSKTLRVDEIVASISETHSFDFQELFAVNTSDVFEGKMYECPLIPVEELKGQFKKTIKKNDILFSEIRPANKHFGMVKIDDTERYVASTKLMVLRMITDEVDLDYFYYWLTNDAFLNVLQSRAENRICSFPQITFDLLSEYEVSVPDKDVQIKISSFLKLLDEKIDNNLKIYMELESMAKTIYDFWFLQFNYPNENGKPYCSDGGKMIRNKKLNRDIPANALVKKVSEIIEVKDGTHDSPKYVESGRPLITSKHLTPYGIDFESANYINEEDYNSINQRSKVDTGDILFSMIGAVGTVYMVDEENIDFAIKNVALYKTSQNMEFQNYLHMTLKSELMKAYINNTMAGSIQKFMSLGSLRDMLIVYDEEVIKKYNECTKDIFERITIIKHENQELLNLRNTLIPLLMNGRITFKED